MLSSVSTRSFRWFLLLVVFALIAAACATEDDGATEPDDDTTEDEVTEPDDEPTDEPTDGETDGEGAEGGTLVWGYDQEPNVLNPTTTDGNMFATSMVALSVVLPLWIITPEFAYEPSPLLESAEATAAGVEPFSVTYNLNPDAVWSDGEAIDAGDVFFTLQTCLNEEWDITSRAGCDKVDMEATEAAMDPGSKTIEVIFIEPYAPWQTIFSTADGVILPQHVLEGEDWNTVWNDEISVASGPFMFEEWNKGQQMSIVRNESYGTYAGRHAYLDRIVFRFLPDSDTQVQQLRGGEIDMFYPQPQLDLVQQVEAIDGVESEASAGPIWEHLDFQQQNPALANQYVRQAMAMGIDRDTFIEQFILPLNPDAEPLNSLVYVNNQTEYEPHLQEFVSYDPQGAVALLEESGCQRGEDNIFVCDGERLSFEWTTTAGNERRELFFEIAQQSLLEIGIEVVPGFGEAAAVFAADVLDAGNWDVFNFAWVGSPDPASNVELWKCEGAQNYHRDCPPDEINELLEETNRAVDPAERASLMNQAGALLAERVPVLPLYQFPTYLAWNGARFTGLRDNPTQWGPVWNVEEWRATGN
jgi:peptide/nickel transport system substrate-binding protein